MEILLTIVIPYFETYELTKKLVEKLMMQMTDETELIILDDGCNEKRFDDMLQGTVIKYKIIHQKNIGVAKTRNKGIELAQGKYIALIDCDDMVTDDYNNTLIDAIDKYNTDIINFNWYDMTTHEIHRKSHNYAPWKAIYKKATMPKFLEDKEYGSEDIWFQGQLEEGIKTGEYTIVYLDKLLYFYNSNREGSLIWKKINKK